MPKPPSRDDVQTPKTSPKPLKKTEHPKPYGTKAEQNKGKRVQPAFQKKQSRKGR